MEPIRLASGSWNGYLETQGQLDVTTEAKEPDPGEQGRLGAVCCLSGQACLGYISFLQKRGSLDLDGQPACSAAREPAETR